jgi:hypothetical protein
VAKLQNYHLLPPLFSFLSTMGWRGEGERWGCVWGERAGPTGAAHRARGTQPPGREKGALSGGDRTGRGAATGEGEGREREALHGRKNEEHEKTIGTTMVEAHLRTRPSPEPSTKSSIGDESMVRSTNRRHQDETLDKMNAAVPSDSADDARIKSNCSPELESEGGVSNLEKGSTRGFQPFIYIYIYIYILLGFEDLLFFVIILYLKLKFIFRKG